MSEANLKDTFYVGRTRVFLYHRDGAEKPFGFRTPGTVARWYASQAAVDGAIKKLRNARSDGKRAYHMQAKMVTFKCACGCGETGTVQASTRNPRYLNEDHRLRARRNRDAKRRQDAKRAEIKARRDAKRAAKKDTATPAGKSSPRDGGVKRMGAGKGKGGVSPSRSPKSKGLYSDQPEPAKSAKRRRVGLPTESD